MSALDALLWTLTLLLWIVLLIPAVALTIMAFCVVGRDLIEHRGLPKPSPIKPPVPATIYLLHPKEPA